MKHVLFASMLLALLVAGCSSSYQYGATRSQKQYLNLYDASGRRKAYGTVSGDGYIQMFAPNGSRRSYGNIK